MFNFIYDFIFALASFFILCNAIAYGVYEINAEKNRSGGVCVIAFSVLVTAFANFIIWTR